MELRTQSIYMKEKPKRFGEINTGDVITDVIHIPMNDLIADFIQAGGRLERAREEYYHDRYGKDDMSDFTPLRPGADPVEADIYMESVETIIKDKSDDIIKSRKAEAARRAKAEEPTGNNGSESVPPVQSGAGPKVPEGTD